MTEERKKPSFRYADRTVEKEKDGVKEIMAVVVMGSDANKVGDLASALKHGSKVHGHFVQNAGIMHLSESSLRERMQHLNVDKPDELASIRSMSAAIDGIHAAQKAAVAPAIERPVIQMNRPLANAV